MQAIAKNPVIRYFIEAKTELQKVAWPTQKETSMYSILVFALSAGLAALFALVDWGLTAGLERLVALTS